MRSEVWKHLWLLVAPHKKHFLLVVLLALLSTGANLIEPLVYREAINDITGLFVKDANDRTRTENGQAVESNDDPVEDFFTRKIDEHKNKAQAKQHSHKSATSADTPRPLIGRTQHIKKPHTATHVSERTPGEAVYTLLWAVAILFWVNVLGYIVWLVGDNMNVKLSCRIEQSFIGNAFAHVLKLPLGFFGTRSSSSIARQIDQSEQVSEIVNAFSQTLLPQSISLIGILAIMFWQNAPLALLAIAVIPIYIFITWRSSQALEKNLDTYYERWEEVSGSISGALNGIKTVKLSGAENTEITNYRNLSGDAYKNYIERSLASNKYTFWQGVLTHLSTSLVLGYGGYLALVHKLTPGDVVMFVSYLDRLYSPIDELASLWVNVQQNIASVARAFRLLDNNTEEKKGIPPNITEGLVEFKNVHFGYTTDREVLQGLNLKLRPANITALVGGSGAGKTTTVDLLLKLYTPQQGSIIIDGQNLDALDPALVRAQIGLVAADGTVFRGTLLDNLRYKRRNATELEVLEAVRKSGLTTLVQRLPQGLQTPIGQNGMGLSVGERQRLQIARVLLSKPKILVMDEATANLDYNTEAEVRKSLEELRQTCTIIIIAHRYSMVKDADYVYVLADGIVSEEGKPEELVNAGGWFSQFANAADEHITNDEEGDTDEEVNEEATDEEE